MTPGDLPEDNPSQRPIYSVNYAFVVEFRREGVAAGTLCGRLEHLSSGRAGRFAGIPELAELVRSILLSAPSDEPAP